MTEGEVHDKLMTAKEVVSKYVNDGCRWRVGGIAIRKPFVFIYEAVRQKKRDLTLILSGWTEDADILIGAGCLSRLEGSYLGLEALGLAHNYRRAYEKGVPREIEIEEYSNFGMTMRFMAAGMGLPFMPVKSHLGSDLIEVEVFRHPKAHVMVDPFGSGEKVALLPACPSDVAVVHAQRVDSEGNAQVWGQVGDDNWGTLSGRRIIVSAEEVVDTEVIRRDPNRTMIPGFRVDAIVEAPFGAHPYQTQGYYDTDFEFRRMYAEVTRTREGFLEFLDEWVYGVEDHEGYLAKLGEERLQSLKARDMWSDPVNYGY